MPDVSVIKLFAFVETDGKKVIQELDLSGVTLRVNDAGKPELFVPPTTIKILPDPGLGGIVVRESSSEPGTFYISVDETMYVRKGVAAQVTIK